MCSYSIIGSDSFISTKLYNSLPVKDAVKLFAIKSSNKVNENVCELFDLSEKELWGSDVVFNFAAIVHQPKLKDDSLYRKVNTDLPIHLASEAKKAGVKHFVQMSTVAVYGNVNSIEIDTEECPINIYGESKLVADRALLSMQDDSFKVSIVRPPMVYGGGLAPGNLMSLIRIAQKGIPMPFKGVDNARDFIHVGNLVNALNLIVEKSISGIVIPTDNKPVSTEQLISLIKKYSKRNVWHVAIPRIGHIFIRKVMPTIYSKVFGDLTVKCNLSCDSYIPTYTIEDGVKEMIDSI